MHELIADTLDDLLVKVFPKILKNGQRVKASKGWNREISGVVLELRNPLARLSRTETKGTVFSCLGETLWYLAKSNQLEFIKYYIHIYGKFAEADGTIHGAYGPRLFSMRNGINQIDNVIKLLQRKPSSRQAVVQLFSAEDILKEYNDVPCTCTMQFFIRRGSLNLVVHMRSNDAFLGLPHDVFAFTFIQELVARSLRLKLGNYKHTGAVIGSYVKWVAPPRTHREMIQGLHKSVGQEPRAVFDSLYRSMDSVMGFGRLGKFDFLTMLGKLGAAPIEPGSAYLVGATGPLQGARLLFTNDSKAKLNPSELDARLAKLDSYLDVGMQVLEDSLCNWQKSPHKFISFRG